MPSASRPPSAERLIQRLQWDDLDVAYLRRLVRSRATRISPASASAAGARTGDLSTACVSGPPRHSAAALVARESLVACDWVGALVLSVYGGRVAAQFRWRDGAAVSPGGVLATLQGDPRVLLAAERILLNFLQRLSGIATQTRATRLRSVPAHAAARHRKTTPGYRMLRKIRRGLRRRLEPSLGLFDRVMLKDNHLALLGFSRQERPGGCLPGLSECRRLAAAVIAPGGPPPARPWRSRWTASTRSPRRSPPAPT